MTHTTTRQATRTVNYDRSGRIVRVQPASRWSGALLSHGAAMLYLSAAALTGMAYILGHLF